MDKINVNLFEKALILLIFLGPLPLSRGIGGYPTPY